MDLKMIEHNIRNDKYIGEEAMIEDMKLMFRNARHYNEEGSQVLFCFYSHIYLSASLQTYKLC